MQDNYFEALRMLVERRVITNRELMLELPCNSPHQYTAMLVKKGFVTVKKKRSKTTDKGYFEYWLNQEELPAIMQEQGRSNERSHSKSSRDEKKQAHPTMRSTLPLTTSETLLNSEEEKARETASGRTQPVLSTMTKETLFGEE